ncbi:MAG: RecQ family ATP-dependent DNA helicase [candidate division Zixibacteria bacterium]|nr:RecQ family ATP-dependent DNA helicase [candidate division Zixibacteria bacterium]
MIETLKKYFGYSDFLPLQKEIICDVLDNKDVLVLMPTGGGKSLCYQLPAVMKDGLTVVVSPLIALMKDQVDDLQSMGIPAVTINSTLPYDRLIEIKSRLVNKQIKLLYVAPERIMIPDFFDFLAQLTVNLIAIDEAHCISEWGHDFRPEYRKLNLLKARFQTVPIIALTSTAILQVQNDIISQLKMKDAKIYRGSLNRKNLFYRIAPKKDVYGNLLRYVKQHPRDSGIIYCQSRKSVENLAERLQEDGIRVLPYHAGLAPEVRNANQEQFIKDNVEIVVATIAFGMGIDKPNVRYVIHCDMPKSVEGYYQETGRAGRDGLNSECLLFFSFSDKIKHEYFINQIEDERFQRIARKKMWDMINFCQTTKCRRKFLLDYFGEKFEAQNCLSCDNCTPLTQEETRKPASQSMPAAKVVTELSAANPKRYQQPTVKTTTKPSADYSKSDQQLFEVLRKLRKEIADSEGMPPYIVFPDTTLREMATIRPVSILGLKTINGVGETKLRKYGSAFLKEIIDFIWANRSSSEAAPALSQGNSLKTKPNYVAKVQEKYPHAYEKWTKEEELKLIAEFNRGKSIPELSNLFGRQIGGIRSRLVKLQ